MLANPITKYQPAEIINFPERRWVNKQVAKAPIWLSTDLRDGNQSLFNPMNVETKLKFFNELVRVGLKEIEVGFPAASAIDLAFVRKLIEENLIPADVTIMVMTQARKDLIDKTIAAVRGCPRVIVHLYNATAPRWREIVFGMTVTEVMELINNHISYLKELTDKLPETEWILQYSPETFSATELEVALQACNTAIAAWGVRIGRPIIINLPTTVENTMPNVFADKIEWMSQRIAHREQVILSVHPHNDRGTGVATAELALLAGADRIEGCLFGNGERSGNVDLVTLALNLYTQGINPGLDFSAINRVAKIVEECTQLPIHPRHPYVGELVFTAFSGSHQDAIRKGFLWQQTQQYWGVPYLPIDPADLGRSYESVIRVNSQSGKGGIAYLLEQNYGITIPRKLQIEFSGIIQQQVDTSEVEIDAAAIWQLFAESYLEYVGGDKDNLEYVDYSLETVAGGRRIVLELAHYGTPVVLSGVGCGVIEAVVNAFANQLEVVNYEEKALSHATTAQAFTLIECCDVNGNTTFAAGINADIVVSSIKALVVAVRRLGLVPQIIKLTNPR